VIVIASTWKVRGNPGKIEIAAASPHNDSYESLNSGQNK